MLVDVVPERFKTYDNDVAVPPIHNHSSYFSLLFESPAYLFPIYTFVTVPSLYLTSCGSLYHMEITHFQTIMIN